jgi:hypothetical protein
MRWRFVKEEDEMLMRSPPFRRRQIIFFQVSSVEDDGVAFIQQISIRRRQAAITAGWIALSERLLADPEAKIVDSKILCPVENNDLVTWLYLALLWRDLFITKVCELS